MCRPHLCQFRAALSAIKLTLLRSWLLASLSNFISKNKFSLTLVQYCLSKWAGYKHLQLFATKFKKKVLLLICERLGELFWLKLPKLCNQKENIASSLHHSQNNVITRHSPNSKRVSTALTVYHKSSSLN